MKKITGKRLKALGFKKRTVNPNESGQRHKYCYFLFEIGSLCLITNTDDEKNFDGDGYFVEFFDNSKVGRYYSFKRVKKLVKILKSGIKSAL